MNIICVVESHDAVGEGPIWHPEQRCVYWVDINGFRIRCFHPETRELRTWQFDELVTALSLTGRAEYLLVAIGGRLILWNSDKDENTEFVAVEHSWPDNRLNDGASGPDGSFWVGSMQNNVAADGGELPITQDSGSLYCVTPQGEVTVQDSGFGITNTIAWSPAGHAFYSGCSRRGVLYAYPYDKSTRKIGRRRIFADAIYPGVPDGSAVDSAGVLWNCRHSGGCVLAFSPSGELLHKIDMPTVNITNCIFGGDDLRTLYVTTAAMGAPLNDAFAGNLFSLRMETPGIAPYRLAS